MATEMQHKALAKVVEYGGKGKRIVKSKILLEIGAAPGTAKTPSKVFESKGFLELADSLGLTDDFLTRALVNDIKKKPGKREKELRLGFQVRGKLKDNGTPPGTTNNFLIIGGDQLKRIASRILDGNTEGEAASGGLSDSNEPQV